MCIILYNQDGRDLNKNHLRVAYDNNPHGYGVMWFEDNRINVVKGICDFNQIWQLTQMLSGMTYSLHLRWRTAGKIGEDQCHPFQVLNKDEHGLDMYLMHNGTLFGMTKHVEKSDTQIFSERLSYKILEKDPFYKLNYFNKFDNAVGRHNKMVVMTSDRRTFFVNKNGGKVINDIWYSNTYSLQAGYRKGILEPKKDVLKLKENKTIFSSEKNEYYKKYFGTRIIKKGVGRISVLSQMHK